MEQRGPVEVELLYPLSRGDVVPPEALGELPLGLRLLRHLEEEEIRQLGDVLVVGDAIVPEDMTQVPQLLNDLAGTHGGQRS